MNILLITEQREGKWNKTSFETLAAAQQIANETKSRLAAAVIGKGVADLAAAASLYRTESRWGLYHLRVDYPDTDNDSWFCHSMHYKDEKGRIAHRKRPIDPYIVPVAAEEMSAYHHLRIKTPVAAE